MSKRAELPDGTGFVLWPFELIQFSLDDRLLLELSVIYYCVPSNTLRNRNEKRPEPIESVRALLGLHLTGVFGSQCE